MNCSTPGFPVLHHLLALAQLTFMELVMPSNHLILCHFLLFFSHLQSFPASGCFSVSQFFSSGDQSSGVSASSSALPINIQSSFPLQLTGLISLLSKGLSRVFSRTTVQKHLLFSALPSLWSNSHIHRWLLEKPWLWLDRSLSANISAFHYIV